MWRVLNSYLLRISLHHQWWKQLVQLWPTNIVKDIQVPDTMEEMSMWIYLNSRVYDFFFFFWKKLLDFGKLVSKVNFFLNIRYTSTTPLIRLMYHEFKEICKNKIRTEYKLHERPSWVFLTKLLQVLKIGNLLRRHWSFLHVILIVFIFPIFLFFLSIYIINS